MAKVTGKKGILTPDDLAAYGIPPQQQPGHDPNLNASDDVEKKPARFNRGPAVLKLVVGE